jgi:hypothetical protein
MQTGSYICALAIIVGGAGRNFGSGTRVAGCWEENMSGGDQRWGWTSGGEYAEYAPAGP